MVDVAPSAAMPSVETGECIAPACLVHEDAPSTAGWPMVRKHGRPNPVTRGVGTKLVLVCVRAGRYRRSASGVRVLRGVDPVGRRTIRERKGVADGPAPPSRRGRDGRQRVARARRRSAHRHSPERRERNSSNAPGSYSEGPGCCGCPSVTRRRGSHRDVRGVRGARAPQRPDLPRLTRACDRRARTRRDTRAAPADRGERP